VQVGNLKNARLSLLFFGSGGGGGRESLGRPVLNNLLGGGGWGGLSSRPGQEVINKTHYTSIHPFSGSQDAQNTSLDLIITCSSVTFTYREKCDQYHTHRDYSVVNKEEAEISVEKYLQTEAKNFYQYYCSYKNQKPCVNGQAESGKIGRLLNHSKQLPNCIAKLIEIENSPRIIIFALKDIS
jgi:hypothetical protein